MPAPRDVGFCGGGQESGARKGATKGHGYVDGLDAGGLSGGPPVGGAGTQASGRRCCARGAVQAAVGISQVALEGISLRRGRRRRRGQREADTPLEGSDGTVTGSP